MSRISRYLVWHYLLGCVPVILILMTLFSFLVLSQELESVGEGLYQTRDALLVTLFTTPARLLELLPVTLLLGSLWGLGGLARHGEIVALRAAGLSVLQLSKPVLVVAGMAVLMVVSLRFAVIPGLEREAQALRAKSESAGFIASEESGGHWMRSGNHFLRIGGFDGLNQLRNVEVYELNENAQVEAFMRAASARVGLGAEWELRDVQRFDVRAGPGSETRHESLIWRSSLSEKQTSSVVAPVEALSPLALYRYIDLLETNRLDNHRQRIIFWQQVSQLLAMVIMAVVSVPFILGTQRSGALARAGLVGGSLGVAFYLAEQLVGHLSVLVNIPPVVAAFVPELLMGLVAILLLRKALAD